jgi:hypothetical protein
VPAALGARRIIGGSPADVRDVPWSVLVFHRIGAGAALCTGAILDETHVLTAGHCVVDSSGQPGVPGDFVVRAGVSDATPVASTDRVQDRAVAAVRVHPRYVASHGESDDVAVLVLANALDLSGPNARAIALPAPGLRLVAGQAVSLAGYGVTAATGDPTTSLNRMTSTLVGDEYCLPPRDVPDSAVLVCAFSGTNAPCHGDSGSVLVLETPTPVAVGVTGAGSCDLNSAAEFADLTAPEVLRFVQGDDDPPVAPRPVKPPSLALATATPQVGQTVGCEPGAWSGSPAFAYSYLEGTNSLVLRTGPPTYRLRVADAGRRILCRVAAANDGGMALGYSATTPEVLSPPELAVPPARARPGGIADVRVTLLGWARPIGRATACAAVSARVGARTCRTVAIAGTTVSLRVPVRRTAPSVSARVAVSVSAADGRSAAGTGTIAIG